MVDGVGIALRVSLHEQLAVCWASMHHVIELFSILSIVFTVSWWDPLSM